jgi:predicted permease
MIKNAFKIAWRNLVRDKQFSFLNLLGLSTGLACSLMIYLWVNDELQIDKFNKKDDRLFSVMKTSPNGDGTIGMYGTTQGLLAESMAKELPEVEYAVAVRAEGISVASTGDKHVKVKTQFAGSDFFNIFSYPVIEGNTKNAFKDKNSVLLSEKLALKLFNTTRGIVGKRIDWSGQREFEGPYTIAGVYTSPPANASDQFDMVFNMEMYAEKEGGTMGDLNFWGSNMMNTYVLLKDGIDPVQFNKKIKDFTKAKISKLYPDNKDMLNYEGDLFVQRYSGKYLYNHYENGVQSGGRIQYVKLFSMIALFILVIACINFMNLSTAKASRRMKEVGIKKVVGAGRGSLILQYMGESVMMSFLSLFIALILVIILLPAFTEITGKAINLHFDSNIIFTVFGITLFTGLVAGSYPSLYLSGFKPVSVLKGKLNTSGGESRVRKGLVVFQFSISVILIVSVMVVYRQMQLIQTTNLGYNKENIIRFSNDGELKTHQLAFLATLKSIPGVGNASDVNGDFVGNAGHSGGGISWDGKDPNLGIEYYGIEAGFGFFETMNLQMSEGRGFSPTFISDSNAVVFNQTAIAAMGIKNPVGKTVSLWGKKKQITGVVKDFHFESLYKKVGPAFIVFSPNNSSTVVKIKAGTEKETISRIEQLYKQYNPGLPLEYQFMDDDYRQLYASEERVSLLSRYFAGIAILISCVGLFGLAAFTAQKRQKEIGIRKVVGATVGNVVFMLSKDFLKLVLIALTIAFPLSWLMMNKWLEGFAYHVPIGVGVFLIAGTAVFVITVLTISFQAIKAALANPVKSLRSE